MSATVIAAASPVLAILTVIACCAFSRRAQRRAQRDMDQAVELTTDQAQAAIIAYLNRRQQLLAALRQQAAEPARDDGTFCFDGLAAELASILREDTGA